MNVDLILPSILLQSRPFSVIVAASPSLAHRLTSLTDGECGRYQSVKQMRSSAYNRSFATIENGE